MTDYVVLRHDGQKWDALQNVEAHSPESACRKTAEARAHTSHADGGDGTYVAVPSSSWKPVEIEVVIAAPRATVKAA